MPIPHCVPKKNSKKVKIAYVVGYIPHIFLDRPHCLGRMCLLYVIWCTNFDVQWSIYPSGTIYYLNLMLNCTTSLIIVHYPPHPPLAPRDDIYPHIACNSNLREIKQERVEHLTSNYELPSPITRWRPGRSECLAVHIVYSHLMLAQPWHQVCAKCAVFSGTCPKLINTVIKHVCLFSANKRSHISQRKMKTDGDPAPRSMQHTSKQLI